MNAAATSLEKMNAERARLLPIFNAVANPNDWKAPIDIWLTLDKCAALKANCADFEEAISFFCGTSTKFEVGMGSMRITSIGYRAGPCGDH